MTKVTLMANKSERTQTPPHNETLGNNNESNQLCLINGTISPYLNIKQFGRIWELHFLLCLQQYQLILYIY